MRPEANGESNAVYTLSEFILDWQDLHWSLFGCAASLKLHLTLFAALLGRCWRLLTTVKLQRKRPGGTIKKKRYT